VTDLKSVPLTPALHEYVVEHGTPPDELQRALIAETATLGGVSRMQIAPEQGALMTLLTRLVGARFAVEVGTFTGYSSICIARGLVDDGRLLCCDVSDEWTTVARRHWADAGLADRIELKLGAAVDTLRALPADPPIDIAFIDADKGGYRSYYEEIVTRLRPGGLVLIDNVLWGGRVVDDSARDEDTVAIRALNDHVASDTRVEPVLLPIADGLTIARRR
jgi:caffeoyl-CoA O-methyltransferase